MEKETFATPVLTLWWSRGAGAVGGAENSVTIMKGHGATVFGEKDVHLCFSSNNVVFV